LDCDLSIASNAVFIQESLANAKVSVRQPWYIGHNSLVHPSLAFFTVTPIPTSRIFSG